MIARLFSWTIEALARSNLIARDHHAGLVEQALEVRVLQLHQLPRFLVGRGHERDAVEDVHRILVAIDAEPDFTGLHLSALNRRLDAVELDQAVVGVKRDLEFATCALFDIPRPICADLAREVVLGSSRWPSSTASAYWRYPPARGQRPRQRWPASRPKNKNG